MAVRAFVCCAPQTSRVLGYVALSRVEEWPPETQIVRLRVGADWSCAWLDRSRVVEVEGMLLRDAVVSDEHDCPGCAPPSTGADEAEPEPQSKARDRSTPVQAAAISVQGQQMVVVLVPRTLIDSPGEAALLQGALRSRFGGAAVVLMGQDDDGSAHWYGEPALVGLLEGVPIERMPWKGYPAP